MPRRSAPATASPSSAAIATRPATPLAIELGFNGSLTVTSNSTVGGPLVQKGSLNGVLALGILAEDQARQSTVEYEFTERFNWPATLRHSGQPGSGAVAMDIALDAAKGLSLRITKTVAGNGVQIVYALAIVAPGTGNSGGTESVTPIGQLVMSADAAAADPANAYHRYAESGLALVQAALVVSEPALKAQAESLLFPAAPAAGPELVIQAVRDWVAFVRRRERRCAPDVPPPPPLPARGYRVIELSFDNLDTLRSVVGRFQLALKDPALLAKLLQELVAVSGRDNIHLVVNYAGGSAAALSDLAEVRADWPSFKPGRAIHYAAIGAVGESDAALQLERLATFKGAIAGLSDEVAGATEDVMLPFPEAGQPDDADGVLLVVTLLDAQPVVRNDIVTVGLVSAAGGSQVPYFLPQQPRATVSFQDNVPQGGTLGGFAGALTAGVAYTAVTLWRNGASIDNGAAARAVAVRDAMAQAGRMAATAPTGTQLLTTQRLAELAAAGVVLTGIDDVIAVERLG